MADDDDTGYVEMLAFLENEVLQDVEAYMKAGRRFAALEDADLDARWVDRFKWWVAHYGEPVDHTEMDECQAEMALRKRQPPLHLVQPEWAKMRAAQNERLRTLTPTELAQREMRITEDVAKFKRAAKDKPSN